MCESQREHFKPIWTMDITCEINVNCYVGQNRKQMKVKYGECQWVER